MTKIEELEEKIKRHSEVSQILTKQLEELKLSVKEEEFKVGDYVFILDKHDSKYNNGEVVKIARMSELRKGFSNTEFYWLYTETGGNDIVLSKNTRKATKEEIESHLISEAEKKGFVKGAKVKVIKDGHNASDFNSIKGKGVYTFHNWRETDFILTGEAKIYKWNNEEYILCWELAKDGIKYFVYDRALELIPSHPSITINGYKAEFKDWGLDFNNGCAKIDKHVFVDFNRFLEIQPCNEQGNKGITSVKIGSGEFTVKQIEEISNYYKK
jgi:hypothetical protein